MQSTPTYKSCDSRALAHELWSANVADIVAIFFFLNKFYIKLEEP